jgi:hypothetical protein
VDAGYWRDYRSRHRERINAQSRARRALGRVRGDRSREYAKRPSRAIPPLAPLYPQNGSVLSYWDDELRMDLRQQAALASLEGWDVEEAVRAYRAKETAWHRITVRIVEER